jgi:hypothetical protein
VVGRIALASFLVAVVSGCGTANPVPTPTPTPSASSTPSPSPLVPSKSLAPLPTLTTVTVPPAPVPAFTYGSCDEVRAAGAAPLHPVDRGWNPKLDRDKDGVACE